jgi:hypothetical protein
MDPEALVGWFRADATRIRLGLFITLFASALLTPWAAAISEQMKRIEGRSAPLASTQLACGALLVLVLIFPIMFWQTGVYRAERAPDSVQMLNDLAWLPFAGIFCTLWMCLPGLW